ncbi:hypothetical protein TSACC_2263 [Terrimicrobium sacchariphilum]|uniref:Verru_Chthon cassette protein A n=1 Tax=Terrimicrobium sacchariphilum TaxID=690879 RepID=A0A146G1X8_TERSA|nr:hypothetical protein [Terrimicrobium sacchariphilum]GAT31869.1 hypothetical protein TSACC_2263 [Terrimicrobium sacchariphilum]
MSRCPDRFPRSTPARRTRGVALITVLSLVVIVCLILVAFVAAMRIERTASYSYSQSISAEQIGQGGLRRIIAELQNEMGKDAAPLLDYPRKPIYTNVSSTNIMPQYVGTNADMPNLLKISTTTAPYTGTLSSGRLVATSVNTSVAAQNGRFVDTNRWNLPQLGRFPGANTTPYWVLMTRSGVTNGSGIGFGATGDTLNNPAAGNTNFVIGRFAYAIYDTGGLLDITQAGHPTSISSSDLQQIKGALPGASLSDSSLSIDEQKLITWRNAASRSSYVSYVTNFLATNAIGTVYPGDNTFLSRQDLIKAAKDGIAGLSTNSLPNLTTFSRDRNAPSWGPTFNASDLGGTNSSLYAYRNNAGVSTTTPFTSANRNPNRLLPGVRFSSTHTITDYDSSGSAYTYKVEPGDAVVQRRFPLPRLAWVGSSGPNGVTAAAVRACFGLSWGASADPNLAGVNVWKYEELTPQSTIKTLDQVASEGRAPNFFELLQAAILRGSLGVNGNAGVTSGTAYNLSIQQTFPAFQILRMGAAAIDQADVDSYPTVIEYQQSGSAWQACGVESLPGIISVTPVVGVPYSSPQTEGETSATAAVYLSFNLWNPHRTTPNNVPELRIRARGSVGVYNMHGDPAVLTSTLGSKSEPGYLADIDEAIELTPSARTGFTTPATLMTTDLQGAKPPATVPTDVDRGEWVEALPLGASLSTSIAALRLSDFRYKLGAASAITTERYQSTKVALGYDNTSPFNAVMEFKSPSGAWVPYQFATGMNNDLTWFNSLGGNFYVVSANARTDGKYFANFIAYLGGTYPAGWTINANSGAVYHGVTNDPWSSPAGTGTVYLTYNNTWERSLMFASNDPRSTRFNTWMFTRNGTVPLGAARSMLLWSSTNNAAPFEKGFGGDSNAVQLKPAIFGTSYFPAQLSRNNFGSSTAISAPDNGVTRTGAGSETSYTDSDGLRRVADSGLYIDAGATTGNPFERALDKPIVLNRPFRSVGELGFVFRDNPWRTADLFSSKSADSALLDVFTIQQSTEPVISGRVNLNTRNPAVLKSLLSDALVDPIDASSLSATDAANLAAAITQFTSTNKLINKSDLVNLVSPYLSPTTGTTKSANFSTLDDQNLKPRREAFIRALSDTTQTRTWNLMIDIIAQSGRYGPAASALDKFIVESERRYWLHVAIDRFTGEVLDQKLEVVTE